MAFSYMLESLLFLLLLLLLALLLLGIGDGHVAASNMHTDTDTMRDDGSPGSAISIKRQENLAVSCTYKMK